MAREYFSTHGEPSVNCSLDFGRIGDANYEESQAAKARQFPPRKNVLVTRSGDKPESHNLL
jgi:hypothetical protein